MNDHEEVPVLIIFIQNQPMYKFLLLLLILVSFESCYKNDTTSLAISAGTNVSNAVAVTNIDSLYTADGSFAVETLTIKDDEGDKLYKIYYPAGLNGTYPLITWGNGTAATAFNYDGVFRHLASWGFIVIDNYDRQTGIGISILESAAYALRLNEKQGSLLYHKIQSNRIGAAGHSQGATGVINAHTKYASGLSSIKALATIALPSSSLTDPGQKYDPSKIVCPVFFISGSRDPLISPLSVNKKAYDQIVGGLPAALGIRIGADHNSIQENNLEWGYLTAWMCYQLKNDMTAKAAFALPGAELLTNTDWKNAAVKNIQ